MEVNYSYDDLGRLDWITDSSDRLIADVSYDAMRRTGLALFNAGTEVAFTAYTYDDANLKFDHMTGLTNSRFSPQTTISRFAYAFDNEGNRLSMEVGGDFSSFTGLHDYSYDMIYQVTGADHPQNYPHPDVTFAYDSMGNRVTVFSGQTDSYDSNNLNQYSSVNGVSFTYDLNGNLTSDGVQTYYYDCENRLTKAVRNSDGQVLGEYKYDPFGRRARKTVNGQPSTVNYLLDGAQVLEERSGDWTLLRSYVYGTGIDEPLCLLQAPGSTLYFYLFDSLGSVTEIADSSGNVLEHYRYSPFGGARIYDSSWTELSESTVGNTYCFTGRNLDAETGLYFYRARMYSAGLGRYLQVDPIGYWDDANLYRYCTNNPINYSDIFGYSAISDTLMGVGAVLVAGGIAAVIVAAYITVMPISIPATGIILVGGYASTTAGGIMFAIGALISPVPCRQEYMDNRPNPDVSTTIEYHDPNRDRWSYPEYDPIADKYR